MERNGVGMISLHYSACDFQNLHLKESSSEDKWNQAIDMFRDRFIERYFDPINALISDPEKNGFAIMAINCLMVDAFYQFEYGDLSTSKNTKHYTKFLKNQLSRIIVDSDMALRFYKDIRCGILHSAQTTNGSMLSTECNDAIEFYGGKSSIKVNVVKFTHAMRTYFDDYVDRLKNGEGDLKTNFITKMNYVCR